VLSVEAVLAALDDANRTIVQHGEAHGMGTTVTGLASLETAGGNHLMVFNVGDSRVYRVADGRLDQVTVGHSEVQELVLAGALTPDQARAHPRRNVVARALGGDLTVRPDHWLLPAIAGDRFLLCSDGLFNELTEDQIRSLLAAGDPQYAATALVAAAVLRGRRSLVVRELARPDGTPTGEPAEVLTRLGTRPCAAFMLVDDHGNWVPAGLTVYLYGPAPDDVRMSHVIASAGVHYFRVAPPPGQWLALTDLAEAVFQSGFPAAENSAPQPAAALLLVAREAGNRTVFVARGQATAGQGAEPAGQGSEPAAFASAAQAVAWMLS
jgi:hypothetical protein